MKKLVFCIPTYNRSSQIKRLLSEMRNGLLANDIDTYIYDSSENNETETLINQLQEEGWTNLFLVKVNSSVPSNEKIFMIYKDMGEKEYEYVWMNHDHESYSDEMVKYICESLESKCSIYAIDKKASAYSHYVIENREEYLAKTAIIATCFGTTILSNAGLIRGTDWDKMFRLCMNKKVICWSHIVYYYTRVAEIRSFKGGYIAVNRNASTDYFDQITDMKNSLYVSVYSWSNAMRALPDSYRNKEQVMQSNIRFSLVNLVEVKKAGNFTFSTFIEYFPALWRMDYRKIIRYARYSVMSVEAIEADIERKYKKKINKDNPKNHPLYFYGAGITAKEYYEFFAARKMPVNGFIVSKKTYDEFCGLPVLEAEEFLKKENAFIMITVATRSIPEIAHKLDQIDAGQGRIAYSTLERC